ncbi:MAG: hypothetical protein U0992_03880 [Planctomycetaceae bacterium]
MRINQLRRKTERWCDCLLGSLPDNHAAEPFAVEVERMRQFTLRGTAAVGRRQARYLALVSLRLSIPGTLIEDQERSRTHRRLLQTVMSFGRRKHSIPMVCWRPLWQRLRGLTDSPPLPGQIPVDRAG